MSTTIYDEDEYYASDGSGARLHVLLDPLLRFLESFKTYLLLKKVSLGKNAKVLDIGAGDGKFLSRLQRHGFQLFGTTASRVSQVTVREKFGIPLVYCTDIPSSVKEQRYSLITYWHVFEHLITPEEHVREWPDLLEANGTVLLEVPALESLGAWLCFDSWLGSDKKHHPNLMSRGSLLELFGKYGFYVERRETFSLKFTFPFLWSGLVGCFFGTKYSFDFILGFLKDPRGAFAQSPVRTVNLVLSVFYLGPLVVLLSLVGWASGRGEVLRLYLKHKA